MALKVPLPPGFHVSTPYVGAACRRLIVDVERELHLPIDGEFAPPLLRKLFPPATVVELRRKIAGVGSWGIRHRAEIGYTQDDSRDDGLQLPPLHLPLPPLDCSMWVDLCYFWAGVPASHCPMGNRYAGWGNTETLLAAGRALPSIAHLRLGDYIVWGRKGASHHAALVIGGVGSANPLLSSHGREACPCSVSFAEEHRAQGGRPATPLTIF